MLAFCLLILNLRSSFIMQSLIKNEYTFNVILQYKNDDNLKKVWQVRLFHTGEVPLLSCRESEDLWNCISLQVKKRLISSTLDWELPPILLLHIFVFFYGSHTFTQCYCLCQLVSISPQYTCFFSYLMTTNNYNSKCVSTIALGQHCSLFVCLDVVYLALPSYESPTFQEFDTI